MERGTGEGEGEGKRQALVFRGLGSFIVLEYLLTLGSLCLLSAGAGLAGKRLWS